MSIFKNVIENFNDKIITPPRIHLSLTKARNPFEQYLNLNISMFRDTFSESLLNDCCAVLFPFIRLKIKSGALTNHGFFAAKEYADPLNDNRVQFHIYEALREASQHDEENDTCAFKKVLSKPAADKLFANEIILAMLPGGKGYRYNSRQGGVIELKIAYNSNVYPDLTNVDFEIQAVIAPVLRDASLTRLYSKFGDVDSEEGEAVNDEVSFPIPDKAKRQVIIAL